LSKKCTIYINIKIIDAQQKGVLQETDIVYIYNMIKKDGLNFVSLYFKIRNW